MCVDRLHDLAVSMQKGCLVAMCCIRMTVLTPPSLKHTTWIGGRHEQAPQACNGLVCDGGPTALRYEVAHSSRRLSSPSGMPVSVTITGFPTAAARMSACEACNDLVMNDQQDSQLHFYMAAIDCQEESRLVAMGLPTADCTDVSMHHGSIESDRVCEKSCKRTV